MSSGSLVLTGSESEDIHATLPGGPYSSSGEISVIMRVKFTSLPSSGGTYFALLKDGGSNSRAQIHARTTGAATDRFRLGISNDGDAVEPIGVDLELNTTYQVRFTWNLANRRATLSVGSSSAVTNMDSASALDISTFAFRQASGIGTLTVDDVWIANGAPQNHDNLANARRLDLFAGNVLDVTSNVSATVEVGELPYPTLTVAGTSVWYQVFAPANAILTISTLGSDFDTAVSVYRQRGSGITGLEAIDGNNNSQSGTFSELDFQTADELGAYYIAVDSYRDPGNNLSKQGFIQISVACDTSQSSFPVYEKLHSFTDALLEEGTEGSTQGGRPLGPLLFASDGNFYGTTTAGGAHNNGTIFQLSEQGKMKILYEFEDTESASQPVGKLSQGTDGNLYGVLSADGYDNDHGAIFRSTLQGQYSTIVQLTGTGGARRGSAPNGGLLRGPDGSFYGTTRSGGTLDMGTVFRVTPLGAFTTLVDFTDNGSTNKGKRPNGDLAWGSDGNLYGTTEEGGIENGGTVFKVTPGGSLTTIREFGFVPTSHTSSANWTNVSIPTATSTFEVSFDITPQAANMDGIVGVGQGAASAYSNLACIVRLSTTGRFDVVSGSGYVAPVTIPYVALKTYRVRMQIDPVAKRYSVWIGQFDQWGYFQQQQLASALPFRTEQTSLSTFNNLAIKRESGSHVISDINLLRGGTHPKCGLTVVNGEFYGMTSSGGFNNNGIVFRINPANAMTTVAHFPGSEDGYAGSDNAPLVLAEDGNLYGSSSLGGTVNSGYFGDPGSIFRVTPQGQYTKLVAFTGNGTTMQGVDPQGLAIGSNGSFFGMTNYGRALYNTNKLYETHGTIFKLGLDGSFATLLEFSGSGTVGKGSRPLAALVEDTDGTLLGTTERGGAYSAGTLFRLHPNGNLTTVWEFTGGGGAGGGRFPRGTMVKANDGKFYGTTYLGGSGGDEDLGTFGTIFRYASGSGMEFFVDFRDSPTYNGKNPLGLTKGPDGHLYGTTDSGGNDFYGGIIYKVTTSGNFTTLQDFSALDENTSGLSNLTLGNDGNFYFDRFGVFYRMTPTGTLTPLGGGSNPGFALEGNLFIGAGGNKIYTINPYGSALNRQDLLTFSGNGHENKGSGPISPLVKGPDGNFYGVTNGGGANNGGTAYRFNKQTGLLTTLYDFSADLPDSKPAAALMLASDGNIYGTTAGDSTTDGHGCVFRLVFPGKPSVYRLPEEAPGYHSVRVKARVNPRGSSASVVLEYRRSSNSTYTTIPLAANLLGAQSVELGTTLTGLSRGQAYVYRFRATNGSGTTLSEERNFTTLGEPLVNAFTPGGVAATSATFRGEVNARSYDATVRFEWGTDGSSFPNSLVAEQGTVTGSSYVPVNAFRDGLSAGTTYHYRIVATNAGGTTVSGTQSFTTLTSPVVTLGNSTALSTTRARIDAIADARGSTASVLVEWGTNGINFPNSVVSNPASVSGSGPVPISATLINLVQGTTYYYRLRAENNGGIGYSNVGVFTLSILSGLDQLFPVPLPAPDGTLTVNLSPPAAGGWRFAGETRWRLSGESATGLATGERLVEFMPVPGYIQPPGELVEVFSGEPPVVLDGEYFLQAGTPAATGGLQVTLEPAAVRNAATPPRWRLLGVDQGNSGWTASGGTRTGLSPGSYLVECEDFDGRVTPQPASIQITSGAPKLLSLTYPLRPAAQGAGVQPVDPAIFADESLPFAWVGQLRGPQGTSSGFAVKRRVVATAAHVVFDDASLAYVPDLQWLHQRHVSLNEPVPQTPRGFFLPTAYEAERKKPGIVPGEGTDRSQHYDYAALYFLSDIARGGFSGFLASEGDENEFLTDPDSPLPSQKILAGYATDIANPADRGKLHATPFTGSIPAFRLTQVAGTIEEVVNNVTQHVAHGTYTTTALSGRAGCSGGPLFVRHPNGSFYPAAIYIGDSGPGIGTIVRGIDLRVVELFGLAETRSYGGGNSTDGGKTLTTTSLGSVTERGALKVVLLPQGLAGAGWRLLPGTTVRTSGYQRDRLRPQSYQVWIAPVAGYLTPPVEPVTITAGELLTFEYTYQSALTPQQTWRQTHFGSAENIGPGADSADPDGDGTTNLDEYAAGSNPKSPTDFFRVSSATRGPGSFTVILAGRKDRTYTLQRRDPTSGNWTPLLPATGPLPADNPALNLIDGNPPSGHSLYRVSVVPP